jgi:hypothetical protein
MRGYLEGMKQTRNAMQPGRHRAAFDAEIKHPQEKFDAELLREVCSKFGVSCWHINEGESAAMWQLYAAAGKGIAIESTRARLEGALHGHSIAVDQVQYMDFDTAEIEEDHDEPYLYALFIKRKSFAHEQELRATIPLSKPGIGTAVPCDMDALIAQIRIFPQAPPYYADAVRYIVGGAHTKVTAPVVPSRLLGPPNY